MAQCPASEVGFPIFPKAVTAIVRLAVPEQEVDRGPRPLRVAGRIRSQVNCGEKINTYTAPPSDPNTCCSLVLNSFRLSIRKSSNLFICQRDSSVGIKCRFKYSGLRVTAHPKRM
jgi:hypothetical protein